MKKNSNKREFDDRGPSFTRKEFLKKSAQTAAALAISGTVAGALSRCGGGGTGADFDVIIRGGTVHDGVTPGTQPVDIGINGDRIGAVGDLSGKRSGRILDAAGCLVTPGFIDIHTHCDLTFLRSGMKRHLARFMPSWKGNYNYLYQGVSTVVTGNCGYGYTDTGRWLDIAGSVGFGSNVMHLVPHGAIREESGLSEVRTLSGPQLSAMKRRVQEEMEKGAVGLSCGLAYAPGLYATTDELVELARVARGRGGIFTIHMRDESGTARPGMPGVLASVREAIEIGRRAEIPVQISHLKIAAPYGGTVPEQLLALIEGARLEGLDVTADQYPYDAGSTVITLLLPNEFITSDSIKSEYKTSEGRRKIKDAVNQTFAYIPPDKTLITYYPGHEEYEGKNILQVSEARGMSPTDAYADMVCDGEHAPLGIFFNQRMDYVRRLMPHEYVFTASDGWTVPMGMTKPHPRAYGTFPRKLRLALDEHLMSLSDAIRSMTSLPAAKFNIRGRGRILAGNFADIAVLDLDSVGDRSTYIDPHRYSTGIRHLTVNGVPAIENNVATGDRGGRVLRAS